MLWRIDEVQVGYHKELAKEYDLDGKDAPDADQLLPELDVDKEIPYSRFSKKNKRNQS